MNGESWLLQGTAGGPRGQGPCRQTKADVLPDQGAAGGPLGAEWAQGVANRYGLFTGAYAAGSLALPSCLLRSPPDGVDPLSLSRHASERCRWLCELSHGQGAQSPVVRLGWLPGRACLGAGTQPGSAAVCAVWEPAHRAGTELCAAAALAHRSLPLCLSPCSALSNMPPSAIRCGHSCGSLLVTTRL